MLGPAPILVINFKSVNFFSNRSAVLKDNPVLMANSDLVMDLLFLKISKANNSSLLSFRIESLSTISFIASVFLRKVNVRMTLFFLSVVSWSDLH